MRKKKQELIKTKLEERRKEFKGRLRTEITRIIKNFDESVKTEDGRSNIKELTGIKVRKLWKFTF